MRYCALMLLFLLLAASAMADEIYLRNGSIVRGKIIEIREDKAYRMRTRDGSEFVYTADQVEKVLFSEEESRKVDSPENTRGAVSASGMSATTERNSIQTGNISTKNITYGIGFGKNGTVGAEMNFRNSDKFGLSLGAGGFLCIIQYKEYHVGYGGYSTYHSYNETDMYAMGGVKLRYYLTPRGLPGQHNVFFRSNYSEFTGPVFGIAYGYERRTISGIGWDVNIGVSAAPGVDERVKNIYGRDIDYQYGPFLIELGIFF